LQLKARHLDGRPWHAADLPFAVALREQRAVTGEWMRIERHPGGDEVLLELSATPIWEEGPGSQLVGVIQSITDRTESALKEQQLTHAYAELRNLQNKLLQRTRAQALGQLASGAAHALNNFLNVIRLRVRLMRTGFKPEHLDALDRTVGQIGELVARLQQFAASHAEETLEVVEIDSVLEDAVELARSELAQGEHPIATEARLEAAAKAKVDATLLRELVVNLLFAARDRMTLGGRVSVRSESDGGWVQVSIEDDGRPYTPAELERLFDPLRGSPNAPLALLLAVGRSQVQRWGGSLSCENCDERDRGARFCIRLPVEVAAERGEPAPPEQPSGAVRPRTQARRVLVVDDDVDNARMMAEVLGDEGYDVKVAHNGKEALALWEAGRFDAALLDALMPDQSGWELARALRQRSPTVLMAMVTGADVRGQNRESLALVDAVFRKPVDIGALDDFLSQARPRAEEREAPVLTH